MRVSSLFLACLTGVVFSITAAAQQQGVILAEEPIRVSDHVYYLKGFPNAGIVIGDRATLVVDTGLGVRNGEIVTRAAKKLAKGPVLYLTTTHYHAEHTAGDGGFPPATIIVRNAAQEEEINKYGADFIANFARRPEMKDLLAGAKIRPADIVFDRELKLDLGGGVSARLLWMGAAHTKGDEMTFVEPDRTLISGDVVQYKQPAGASAPDASIKNWSDILDKLPSLNARVILPDHSEPGDAAQWIATQKGFLLDLVKRALDAKHAGVPVEDAAKKITDEMKAAYPGWEQWFAVPGSVRKVYAEYP
jgi:glyoxylase-like metal-dependent hydrolase (beta-lactamase superfamily II)